jgi:hypothetical protein
LRCRQEADRNGENGYEFHKLILKEKCHYNRKVFIQDLVPLQDTDEPLKH